MNELLDKIDAYIVQLTGRELVSTNEVQDLLLDLRLLATVETPEPALVGATE